MSASVPIRRGWYRLRGGQCVFTIRPGAGGVGIVWDRISLRSASTGTGLAQETAVRTSLQSVWDPTGSPSVPCGA